MCGWRAFDAGWAFDWRSNSSTLALKWLAFRKPELERLQSSLPTDFSGQRGVELWFNQFGTIAESGFQGSWTEKIRAGKVIALHASPPCDCETYTDARWLPPPTDSGRPRPLRDWCFPWGWEALDLKELSQLRIGNVLYTIWSFPDLGQCFHGAFVETPQMPAPHIQSRVLGAVFLETYDLFAGSVGMPGWLHPEGLHTWRPILWVGRHLSHHRRMENGSCQSLSSRPLPSDSPSGDLLFRECEGSPYGSRDAENLISQWPPAMSGPFDPYAVSDAGLTMGPDFWKFTPCGVVGALRLFPTFLFVWWNLHIASRQRKIASGLVEKLMLSISI